MRHVKGPSNNYVFDTGEAEAAAQQRELASADVNLLTQLGRQIYDLVYPPHQRGEQWIQEDFEESMITALTALRFFAEDAECLTWEHLTDNADNRFHTEIARAEAQGACYS
jgi:hypothetical protein